MMSFVESTRTMQIDITAGVIFLFCFFVILHTQQRHHHVAFRHQIAGIGGAVLFFAIFVMLMFVRKQMIDETEVSVFLLPFASAPLLLYAALFVGGMLLLIYESVYDVRTFHSSLSEYSILQAVNELNDGLVIFDKNKRVVFANQKMHELSFAIFGQSLYRFAHFLEWIENGFCAENVHCLPQLPHAAYYLPDGKVWQIRQMEITVDGENFCEVVASDITQQYGLRQKIEEENALLKKQQQLIADSAKIIIENNVKEEQLAYKMRIHDSLGQCVTTVSHIMQDTGDAQACAKLWAEAVAGLRTYEDNTNTEENAGQRAFREQLRLLEQLGCTVKLEGPMPSRTLHAQIFRDAIRTAAINAVRHANANILFVETRIDGAAFDISISDNGRSAINHLTEGGGLSSLRQKVESADGEMIITTEMKVKIYIHLPSTKMDFL